MRTPQRWAVCVRRPDGSLHIEAEPVVERWPRLKQTFLRGPVSIVEAVAMGMRGIEIALRQAGQPVDSRAVSVVVIPVAIGVLGLFVALPGMLTAGLGGVLADVVEATARAAMLLIYLASLGRAQQSRRLFGYHGAEHMAIATYERIGRVPSVEQARAASPIHVRCGTDFISLFVIASGVAFSFVGRRPVWLGGLVRVLLVPVVAVAAYEVMRLGARYPRQFWALAVTWPGRALQRITTRPPDDGQLEVAVTALAACVEGPAACVEGPAG